MLVAIALTAEPQRLSGASATATLRIAAPPDATIFLSTSSGTIGAVAAGSAQYTATAETFPRVALVLARVESHGIVERRWLAIPIDGRDTLNLSTKPSSRVEVQIGDATFGPVRSDKSGRAQVPVVVPPGVRTATVHVRDSFGNEKETSFDLRPPPFQRAWMVALQSVASWADARPAAIEIFAVEGSGGPARRADVTLSADRGELGELQETAPGVFVAPYRAPEKITAADAHVQAQIFGDLSLPQSVKLSILPGPAARIALAASAKSAGPGEVVRIEAAVEDGQGNPLPDLAQVTCDAGVVTPKTSRSFELRAPDSFAGHDAMRVVAKSGAAKETLAIALVAGAPAAVRVQFTAPEVREGEQVDATVAVADSAGNPVPGAALQVDALGAALLKTRELGQGRYAVLLRALPASAPSAELRVGAGATRTAARFAVVPEEKPWGLSVGGWVLGQHNFSRAASIGLELEVASHAGLSWLEVFGRAQGVQFAPATSPIDTGSVERASLRGFGLLAGARALLPLRTPWSLHASAEAGALRAVGTLRVQGGPADGVEEPTARWAPSLSAGAGGSLRLGPGRILAELQFAAVPSSGNVQGNLGGLWLRAGWLLNLR